MIHYSGGGIRPKLIERHIVTENLTEGKGDSDVAKQIRDNSHRLGKPRNEIEQDIARRSFGEIDNNDGIDTAERIE